MNTSFSEGFSLWFYASSRAIIVYIIFLLLYFVFSWSLWLTTNIFMIYIKNTLKYWTVLAFFIAQIIFLRKWIEEYYKGDLD